MEFYGCHGDRNPDRYGVGEESLSSESENESEKQRRRDEEVQEGKRRRKEEDRQRRVERMAEIKREIARLRQEYETLKASLDVDHLVPRGEVKSESVE
jgi:hypothetical protein